MSLKCNGYHEFEFTFRLFAEAFSDGMPLIYLGVWGTGSNIIGFWTNSYIGFSWEVVSIFDGPWTWPQRKLYLHSICLSKVTEQHTTVNRDHCVSSILYEYTSYMMCRTEFVELTDLSGIFISILYQRGPLLYYVNGNY